MRPAFIAALVALLLAWAAVAAHGQTVQGTLTDSATQRPVVGAPVVILDHTGSKRGTTRTDESGSFRLHVSPGSYWIQIQPDGYEIVETRPFVVERPDSLDLALTTRPEVTRLEGVTVEASFTRNRNFAGFLERERIEFGHFLGPDDIRRARATRASDLFMNLVPGLDVNQAAEGALLFRNRGRVCAPILVVDGFRAAGNAVDQVVIGSEVRAVEVYSQPELAPPGLSMAPFNQCGVVAIWTAFGLGID
jgi:hypothetical protein